MKVKVNSDICIGCGACVAIAPDTFEFSDEGTSVVKNDQVTDDAKSASESCPVNAISIDNMDEKKEA
ncbi:MAG TPA: ferredoxin [Bacilli bacterium]|nr:ferredoxin [Bacilli bacterium]HPZ23501.1 ferredoxin [Bacilli bacterium]HQC83936.1 ferredoxin [Bacilli bacterium]